MFKLKYIILIFQFIALSTFSQGGWKKQYYLQNSLTSISGNVIEMPSGNLLTIGITVDTLSNLQFNQLTLMATDADGTYLWKKHYGNKQWEYLNNSVLQDQNGFYLAACVKDSNNKWPSVLIRFDYNGDSLWQQKYYSNQANVNLYITGLTKGVDSSILMCGQLEDFNLPLRPSIILKTNLQGTEIWRSIINKALPNVNPSNDLVQDSATKRIIAVGYQYIGNSTSWDAFSNVLILDSLGNKIHHKSFNNAGGGGFASVIQLKDGNFLSGGQWFEQQVGATTKYRSFLVKFDTAGTVIWSKKYGIISPGNVMGLFYEYPNGEIMVGGNLDTMQNYLTQPVVKVTVSRTDASGNLKWQRYIGSSHSHAMSEGTSSMRRTSDGGFVLSTSFQYKQSPQPYSIIKIDSLGCDTLAAYCQSPVGLDEFYDRTGFAFEMFPNPANEFMKFNISSSINSQFEIRISDLQGRYLENLVFDKTGTFEVATKKYSSGVYLVSILYDGNAIVTKKLVIHH